MKKINTSNLLIIFTIIAGLFVLVYTYCNPIHNNIVRDECADVVSVNDYIVTVITNDGNEWCYYDDERLTRKGDLVRVTLNDSGTDEIDDDEIIKAVNLSLLTRVK